MHPVEFHLLELKLHTSILYPCVPLMLLIPPIRYFKVLLHLIFDHRILVVQVVPGLPVQLLPRAFGGLVRRNRWTGLDNLIQSVIRTRVYAQLIGAFFKD
jgi:hypothetical protein